LLGLAGPILIAGGQAMEDNTDVFVGIDVAKLRNAVAVADGGRNGELRFLGEFDADEASMRRVVKWLADKCRLPKFLSLSRTIWNPLCHY
jgi:transposase